MSKLITAGGKLAADGSTLIYMSESEMQSLCCRWQGRAIWEATGGTCSAGVFSGGAWTLQSFDTFSVPLCDTNYETPGEYYSNLVCGDAYVPIGATCTVWGAVKDYDIAKTQSGAGLSSAPSIAYFAMRLTVYFSAAYWDGEFYFGEQSGLYYWSPCESAQDAIDAYGLTDCDGTCQDGEWCAANVNTTHCPGDSGDPYPAYPDTPEGDPCA
jgi:hypothetical protein